MAEANGLGDLITVGPAVAVHRSPRDCDSTKAPRTNARSRSNILAMSATDTLHRLCSAMMTRRSRSGSAAEPSPKIASCSRAMVMVRHSKNSANNFPTPLVHSLETLVTVNPTVRWTASGSPQSTCATLSISGCSPAHSFVSDSTRVRLPLASLKTDPRLSADTAPLDVPKSTSAAPTGGSSPVIPPARKAPAAVQRTPAIQRAALSGWNSPARHRGRGASQVIRHLAIGAAVDVGHSKPFQGPTQRERNPLPY